MHTWFLSIQMIPLVHPLTQSPSPKEKHETTSLSRLWLSPKPLNVRCPSLYQAKYSWARTRIQFNYERSETLSEGLSLVLNSLVQLTLPKSWNHNTSVLSPRLHSSSWASTLSGVWIIMLIGLGTNSSPWIYCFYVKVVRSGEKCLSWERWAGTWIVLQQESNWAQAQGQPWWRRVSGSRPGKHPVRWRGVSFGFVYLV